MRMRACVCVRVCACTVSAFVSVLVCALEQASVCFMFSKLGRQIIDAYHLSLNAGDKRIGFIVTLLLVCVLRVRSL